MPRESDDGVRWADLATDQLRAIAPWPDPDEAEPGGAVAEARANEHPIPRAVNPA